MVRYTMLAVALLALTGASNARAQDTDETKRLKDKIELLETKLKLAERDIQDLKKENDQLKAGGAKGPAARDDGLGVGTKLAGTLTRSWITNGKQMTAGGGVEFEVTKRSGKDFTAEFWDDTRKGGFGLEGTIENGVVKFKSTKSLTDAAADVVGLHTFTGRLDKGILTGRTTKKGDASYKGEWKLSPKKE